MNRLGGLCLSNYDPMMGHGDLRHSVAVMQEGRCACDPFFSPRPVHEI